MGGSGYSLFVQDMMQTSTGGALASIQHGGGFGGSGQMASSANGVAKVNACMGNATGTLKPHAWSVITYNAGLHDCDTQEWVSAADYAANLRAALRILEPAASAVYFVTSTPFDMPHTNAGITMACVLAGCSAPSAPHGADEADMRIVSLNPCTDAILAEVARKCRATSAACDHTASAVRSRRAVSVQ